MSVKELYIGEDINNLENPKDINEELAHRYSEAYPEIICMSSYRFLVFVPIQLLDQKKVKMVVIGNKLVTRLNVL